MAIMPCALRMDDTLGANGDDENRTPVTPGEILAEEFLAGFDLTQAGLARAIGVSPNRIAEIVNNRRRISADTALRLGLYFNTSPEFWQNLQAHYDLKMARRALAPDDAARIVAHRVA